jgi:hypothetical protein
MLWPPWWEWELEFTSHLEERMIDRSYNEVDLRMMLETASGLRPNHVDGRYVVDTAHDKRPWEVIVEPIEDEQVLVIVTAYPVD